MEDQMEKEDKRKSAKNQKVPPKRPAPQKKR